MKRLVLLFGILCCVALVRHTDARAATDKSYDALRTLVKGKPVAAAPLRKLLLKTPLPASFLQTIYQWSAKVLRNAIFALHGARFKGKHLRKIFGAQTWYKGQVAPQKISLGAIAKQNVNALLMVEKLAKSQRGFLGELPSALSKRGKRICLRYKNATIVQTETRVFVLRQGSCQIQPKRLIMRIKRTDDDGEKPRVRGHYKGFVVLHSTGSSDMQHLHVYQLKTKKRIYHGKDLSGQATFTIATEGKAAYLRFQNGLDFPKSCASKAKTYLGREKACWPVLQRKYKAIRKATRPKCKCMGGLGPYVLAGYQISLTKPVGTISLTGEIKCGCSS